MVGDRWLVGSSPATGHRPLLIIIAMVYYLYLALAAYAAVFLIYNFVKAKKWEEEALYVIVLIPFLLRIFGLK